MSWFSRKKLVDPLKEAVATKKEAIKTFHSLLDDLEELIRSERRAIVSVKEDLSILNTRVKKAKAEGDDLTARVLMGRILSKEAEAKQKETRLQNAIQTQSSRYIELHEAQDELIRLESEISEKTIRTGLAEAKKAVGNIEIDLDDLNQKAAAAEGSADLDRELKPFEDAAQQEEIERRLKALE